MSSLLYLVFHFYLLMMLALLARTAAEFDKQLRSTLPVEPERERYRAQVGNALFLQLLVGMKGERTGVNALLMGLIALITIVLAPLATLVLMQMMFLPYHHFRITWWHRVVVVTDLVLIVVMTYRCFFPRGIKKAPLVLGALNRKPRWATAMAFCLLLAVALAPPVDWLSFQQGRWSGEPRPSSVAEWGWWMAGESTPLPQMNLDYYKATANGIVFGLFPDRLELANESIVGKEKLEKTKEEIASRGGDFVPTIKLDGRDLQAANLSGADLRGVSLDSAIVRGAHLGRARLDSALLYSAQLQGTELGDAQLQGANLGRAQLQGAYLAFANLQGADLGRARLQDADLRAAQLQGADLATTELQGAELGGAQLLGANLSYAQLEGTDLDHAESEGAELFETQLQGANLRGAKLADADFDGTFVFGIETCDADLETAAGRSVEVHKVVLSRGKKDEPTEIDVRNWIAAATEFARHQGDISAISQRFDRLKESLHSANQSSGDRGLCRFHSLLSNTFGLSFILDPSDAKFHTRLADRLSNLACDPVGSPYVARALIDSHMGSRLAALGDQLEGVRERMKAGRKDPDACKGVAGFTEEDWRKLDEIKLGAAADR
jgi:uncharacterized protein YjbI with pentapeptide repeats